MASTEPQQVDVDVASRASKEPKKGGAGGLERGVSLCVLGISLALSIFAVALTLVRTPIGTPTCVSPMDDPPNTIGIFEGQPPAFDLMPGATEPGERTKRGVQHEYLATSPVVPHLVGVRKVDGTYDEGHHLPGEPADPCTWVWSCVWSLYCVDHLNTGIKIRTPTEIDQNGIVQKMSARKLNIGPQYLIEDGTPNPNHKDGVVASIWKRVG